MKPLLLLILSILFYLQIAASLYQLGFGISMYDKSPPHRPAGLFYAAYSLTPWRADYAQSYELQWTKMIERSEDPAKVVWSIRMTAAKFPEDAKLEKLRASVNGKANLDWTK